MPVSAILMPISEGLGIRAWKRLDKVEEMAIIRGVLGWPNRQEEAMSARAKQVGLLPTQAHSDSEQKLRKLEGGTRLGRLGRLPENFFVLLS